MYTIWVKMRKLGKKNRDSIAPVAYELEQRPSTVRELITELTKKGVEAYNAREDKGQIVSHLTKQEIEAKAETGKIAFGLRGGNAADPDAAVKNALECFEDGIFRIFADDRELTMLEEVIPWRKTACDASRTETLEKDGTIAEPIFTFIRLTMLAGC